MCSIEQGELLGFARGQRKLEPDFKQLNADVALLPATCYKIYLGLKGQQLMARGWSPASRAASAMKTRRWTATAPSTSP